MTDTATQPTDEQKVARALARAIWRADHPAGEKQTAEERQAAWKADRAGAVKKAGRVLRDLNRGGVTLTLSGEQSDELED